MTSQYSSVDEPVYHNVLKKSIPLQVIVDIFVTFVYLFKKVVRYSVSIDKNSQDLVPEKHISSLFGITGPAVSALFSCGYLEKCPSRMYRVENVRSAIIASMCGVARPYECSPSDKLDSVHTWEQFIAKCLSEIDTMRAERADLTTHEAAGYMAKSIFEGIRTSLRAGSDVYLPIGSISPVFRKARDVYVRMLNQHTRCGERMDVALIRNVSAIRKLFVQDAHIGE